MVNSIDDNLAGWSRREFLKKGCLTAASTHLPKFASALGFAGAAPFDVVVYGGTSSGCIAAAQAAKMGKSVLLIEPSMHLGGMTSSGLGWVDTGVSDAIGGLTRAFFHRVWQHYQNTKSWKWEKPVSLQEQHPALRANDETMWLVEPSVAEQIFDNFISKAGVHVVRDERLERKTGVRKDGERIVSIAMESGRVFAGKMFIDATYEGDLMAAAKVSYFVGREANSRYGETRNGIRPFPQYAPLMRIDPYQIKGRPESGLLPRVHPNLEGKAFEEDHGVQAYSYRLCLTDVPENRTKIEKPVGYNELDYELLFRYIEQGAEKDSFLKLRLLPNRKTDVISKHYISTDFIGMSWAWPEADYATRDGIARAHETYERGLIWTLQNHSRVSKEIRDFYAPWGLAKDEFVTNGNWPGRLYVREARRMISDLVMTEELAANLKPAPTDSVGLGSYTFDCHIVKYYVDEASGFVAVDGELARPPLPDRPPHPYPISYRSIIPKRGECENLSVPVCLSASHVAYGSIRMEPVLMVLGQSAATAVCMAINKNVALQNLPYAPLREQLLKDGQLIV